MNPQQPSNPQPGPTFTAAWRCRKLPLLAMLLGVCVAMSAVASAGTFANPIAEGADPWVVRHGDQYIWCKTEGSRGISLWISDRLHSLGERHRIWTAPEEGPYSREVWAPELHLLDDRWHIYFAASDGRNENHLTYVLRSATDDVLGDYELHGPLATGDGPDRLEPNVWAIDMTVMEHDGRRYAIWSGWDVPGSDNQFLYIAAMKSPLELSGPRVRICANDDYLWERTEERLGSRGLHEGPQVLRGGGRTFLVYSCGASWLPTYKYGLLELTGDDPLDPAAWKKFPDPVFQSTPRTFGVGHGCFVKSPDGRENWHVFHVKQDSEPGWRRSIFIQPFSFTAEGLPVFDAPVDAGLALPLPSGSPLPQPGGPITKDLSQDAGVSGFSHYGHHQFLETSPEGVILGEVPEHPLNTYRSGEKLVLDDMVYGDFSAEVTIRPLGGGRDAGLLFRVSSPALGYDAQKGYFAGLLTGSDRIVLGRTDGRGWQELGRAGRSLEDGKDYRLAVNARGDSLVVSLDGDPVIDVRDDRWQSGLVGLRVVNSHARFADLIVRPHARP